MSWFYFDIPKKVTPESELPAAHSNISQIPMIGNNDLLIDSDQQYQKPLFRSTDTKYITLCKMGGRQDLLTFKDRKTTSDSPVQYPRCEWYYLEDNAAEDELTKPDSKYVPRQPDYMVHNYERGEAQKGVGIRGRDRYPYFRDMERTNKMEMCIPEPKKFGTGVRAAKQRAKLEKAIKGTTLPQIHNANDNARRKVVLESQPTMGKLMSNYYIK